jgi:hypothetical protein
MDSKIAGQIHDYLETAAPPIRFSSVTRSLQAPGQARRSAFIRQLNPQRAIAVVAATAVAAAAVTIGIQAAGRGAAHTPETSVLTAAMVHRVEAATEAAIAPAGHILVTYSLGPIRRSPTSSGAIDFTFSGRNFNAVDRLPAAPDDNAGRTFTIRIVNGDIYTFGGSGRPRQWYRVLGQPQAGRAVPDPRKVLEALRPEAGFKVIGSQLIDGVPTRILTATRLTQLPASILSSLTFVSSMGPQSLAAFDVWVDSHDVVRQIKITHYDQTGQGRLIDIQTIRFLDIGRPEKITAPAHFVNEKASS